MLGAGRKTLDDLIDPAVGVILRKKIGDKLSKGDPVLEIHYNHAEKLQEALALFESAVKIASNPVEPPVLIKKVISIAE